MRYEFAGGPSDYTISVGASVTISTPAGDVPGQTAVVIGNQPVTFWTDEEGGTQYTDLLNDQGDPVTFVTSSNGSTRGLGQIATLSGPDDVVVMWAQAGDGPRVRMVANVAPEVLETARELALHTQGRNAHGTGVADLSDVAAPPAASRTVGTVLGVVEGGTFGLLSPAQVSGALLLNPPKTPEGVYTGNVAQAPDPAQGQNGEPWLKIQTAYSGGDNNPDTIQIFSTSSAGAPIKTGWFNGNGEIRSAPSLKNRVGFRAFEAYENKDGPSTQRFFELSTNPTNAGLREPLFGAYGTAHATMPGWMVATRVLAGQKGVQAGGNHNGLSAFTFRGQKTGAGAPTSGTWVAGDVVLDAAGFFWLCSASGTPGTWVGGPGSGGGGGEPNEAGPGPLVNVTPGTGMALDSSRPAATRLERGGDYVRLRGTLNSTASVASGAVLATLSNPAHRPASTVSAIARSTGGGNRLTIAPNGEISYSASFTAGQSLWLDAITYDLL